MSVTIEDYLSLVESQHKVRPRFMAVLTDYLRPVVDAHNLSDELPKAFSVENAQGAQLDIIGQIVGVSRNFPYISGQTTETKSMNDDQYRLVIRATIARNQWDGSFRSFAKTWNEIFAGQAINAVVVDGMDMSCQVTMSGDFDSDMAVLISSGYVFPKPMGVRMTYAVSPQGDRTGNASLNAGAAQSTDTTIITITAQ